MPAIGMAQRQEITVCSWLFICFWLLTGRGGPGEASAGWAQKQQQQQQQQQQQNQRERPLRRYTFFLPFPNPNPKMGPDFNFTAIYYGINLDQLADNKTGLWPKDQQQPSPYLLPADKAACPLGEEDQPFSLEIADTDVVFLRVLVTQKVKDIVIPMDAYLAIPNECLGNEYENYEDRYRSKYKDWKYIMLTNVDKEKNITIFNPLKSVFLKNKDKYINDITLQPLQSNFLNSRQLPFARNIHFSSDNFKFLTGTAFTLTGRTENINKIEMLPPVSFFGTEYIVPLIRPLFGPHAISIKSISTSLKNRVEVKECSGRMSATTRVFSINYDTIKYIFPREPIHIRGSGKLLVVQDLSGNDTMYPSLITLIPPVDRWTWKAVVLPLHMTKMPGQWVHTSMQYVSVIFYTSHQETMEFIDLRDGKDITYSINFTKLERSDFSQAVTQLKTKEDGLWIQNTNFSPFQVIQYGAMRNGYLTYALPASMKLDCNASIVNDPDSREAKIQSPCHISQRTATSGLTSPNTCPQLPRATGKVLGDTDRSLIYILAILCAILLCAIVATVVWKRRYCVKTEAQDESAVNEQDKSLQDPDSEGSEIEKASSGSDSNSGTSVDQETTSKAETTSRQRSSY